tara:strand:+ start:976 stop:2103 length:1128 start_codon:yes stop_codon:yes gene_type:complete
MSDLSKNIYLNARISHLQRNFRIKKINKLLINFRELNLQIHADKMDFHQFSKLIRTKNVILNIKAISDYFNIIGFKNKLNGQKLLTSFILKYFAREILGNEQNRHIEDKSIIKWGENLIDIFLNIKLDNYTSLKNLGLFLVNYEKAIIIWLKNDKSRTIESIIISYYNRMDHIKIIKTSNKIDDQQKEQMLKELKNEIRELLISMKLLDKSFDLEYFQKNYVKIYHNIEQGYKNVLNSLTVNMKKAFSAKLLEDIKNGGIKTILLNFMEIGNRLIQICPHKYKESFKNKFKEDHIIDFLIENEWNKKLVDHLNFMVDSIIMFDSKENEKKNFEFKQNINILTLNDYENNMVKIILLINEKIDDLVKLIFEFAKKK